MSAQLAGNCNGRERFNHLPMPTRLPTTGTCACHTSASQHVPLPLPHSFTGQTWLVLCCAGHSATRPGWSCTLQQLPRVLLDVHRQHTHLRTRTAVRRTEPPERLTRVCPRATAARSLCSHARLPESACVYMRNPGPPSYGRSPVPEYRGAREVQHTAALSDAPTHEVVDPRWWIAVTCRYTRRWTAPSRMTTPLLR